MTTLSNHTSSSLLSHCKSALINKKLSLTSRKLYLADIKRFLTWLPSNNLTPGSLSSPDLYQDYLKNLETQGLSPSMLKRTTASLRQLGHIVDDLYNLGNPTLSLSISSPKPRTSNQELATSKYIKHFTNYLKLSHLSPSTIKSYKSDVSRYLTWADQHLPSTKIEGVLKNKNIEKYLNYLTKSGEYPESTRTRKRASLTRFQSWYLEAYGERKAPDNTPSSGKGLSLTGIPDCKSRRARQPAKGQSLQGIFPILSFSLIALLTLGLAYFGYQAFSRDQVLLSQAYPSSPISPNRQLSFQGRLEDSGGTPITSSTNLVFKLFDASTVGSELYSTGACAVTPDTDGVFSTQIGSTCGSGITADVFSENADVWLEVTVGAETLTPRQQIATVAYALNSETLQGIPLSSTMSAIANSIVPMNSYGEIIIGEQSPRMTGVSGTFAISAPALSLTTTTGSSGNISIAPDGTGQVNITGNTTSTNFFNVSNAQLTTGSLITGTVANSNTGYKLLDLLSGTSPTSIFSVADDGDTYIAGNVGIGTTSPGAKLQINTDTVTGEALYLKPLNSSNPLKINVRSGTDITSPEYDFISGTGGNTYTDFLINDTGSYRGAMRLGSPVSSGVTLFGISSSYDSGATWDNHLSVVKGGDVYISDGLSLYETAVSDGTIEATQFCTGDGESNCVTDFSSLTSGASIWTDGGDATYLTSETDDLAIGGSTSSSPFFFDESAELLTLTNTTAGDSFRVNDVASDTTPFIIDADGNVGIGTTAPGSKLHVYGTSGELATFGADAHADQYIIVRDNSTYGSMFGYEDTLNGTLIQSGLSKNIAFNVNSGTYGSGTNAMFIESTGNVGIGTTAPQSLLDVQGGAGAAGILTLASQELTVVDGDKLGQINFNAPLESDGTDSILVGASIWAEADDIFSTTVNSTELVFATGTSATATEKMRIDSAGNVGIGTTNPSAKLDLYGAASDTIATRNFLAFTNVVDSFMQMGLDANGNLAIDNVYGADTNIMTIGRTGNVGIGDTSPDAPLDVVGDVYISDGLSLYENSISDGTIEATQFCTGDGESNCVTDFSSLTSGASIWTDAGTITHLTSTTDDLALGGTTSSSPFFFDESAELLTLTNTTAGDSFRVNDAASDTTPFIIDADGNVGIGTTSPDYKLEVVGGSGGVETDLLQIRSDSTAENTASTLRFINNTLPTSNYGAGEISVERISADGVMTFRTSDNGTMSDSLTILGDGNVGINTTAPQSLLDVQGGAGAAGILTLASKELTVVDGDKLGQINFNAPLESDGSDSTLVGASIWAEADATFSTTVNSTELVFATGTSATATERMRIDSAGKVGIGTATPVAKLDVWQSGGAGGDLLHLRDNTDAKDLYIRYDGTDAFEFWTESGGTGTNILTLEETTGNVGIGTTSPGTKLEVNSGTTNTVARFISSDSGVNIAFKDNTTSNNYLGIGALGDDLLFYSAAGNENMRIQGGNLGIGTTSPGAKLEVYGSSGTFLDIQDDGSSVFTVSDTAVTSNLPTSFTSAGDVAIAYDLVFTNPTASYIQSSAPLYLQAGESYASSDLTLSTYNAGDIILDAGDASGDTGTIQFYDSYVKAATITTPIAFSDSATDINTYRSNFTDETLIGAINETYLAVTGGGGGLWTRSGTDTYLTNTGDNVGIGTTSPNALLDVSANTNATILTSSTDGSLAAGEIIGKFGFYKTDASTGGAGTPTYIQSRAYDLGGLFEMDFITGSISAPVTTMTLGRTGNVGIGTTAPGKKLEVNGNVAANIFYDTAGSTYYLDPAATGTSLIVDGNIISDGAYSITSNGTNGNITLDAGTGTVVVGSSGTGKLDAGTIDPPYSINGDKFATYLSGMTGVKEETTGTVNTSEHIPGYGYRTTLNLASATQGSDLWLFRQITNLHAQFDQLVVLLSSATNTRTWYNLHPDSGIIEIYSSQPSTISYRLTAPRFDADTWANTRDSESLGFVLDGQPNWDPTTTTPPPTLSDTFTEIFHSLTTSIAQVTSLETNLISPLDTSQPLTISTNTVITPTLDSSPTLTVEGEISTDTISAREARFTHITTNRLYADEIIAGKITANVIEGLDAKIVSLSAGSTTELSDDDLETITDRIKARLADLSGATAEDISTPPEATSSSQFLVLSSQDETPIASDSATLASLDADFVTINDYLAVIGSAAMTNLDITGLFYTDSIISKSNTLSLQPNGGLIRMANNTLIVDSTGQVMINGDLSVSGKILASSANLGSLELGTPPATPSSQLGQLLSVYNESGKAVATIDASGSASFRDLSTQLITIASPSNSTQSASTSALATTMGTTSTSNATAGNSSLITPNTEVHIESEYITPNTLVYLTPTTNTDNKVLFVAAKETCPPPPPDVSVVLTPCTRSFTVAIDSPASTDIDFNWWVIQLEAQP